MSKWNKYVFAIEVLSVYEVYRYRPLNLTTSLYIDIAASTLNSFTITELALNVVEQSGQFVKV